MSQDDHQKPPSEDPGQDQAETFAMDDFDPEALERRPRRDHAETFAMDNFDPSVLDREPTLDPDPDDEASEAFTTMAMQSPFHPGAGDAATTEPAASPVKTEPAKYRAPVKKPTPTPEDGAQSTMAMQSPFHPTPPSDDDPGEHPATMAIMSPFHPASQQGAEGEGAPKNIKDFAVAGVLNYVRNIGPHARRVFRGNLATNLASADERILLADAHGVTGESSQSYITWRRSALVLMIVPLTINVIISMIQQSISLVDTSMFTGGLESMRPVHIGIKIFEITSYALSLVFAMLALRSWDRYKRSRRLLATSWLISFSVPFLIGLVPLHHFIDAQGLVPGEVRDFIYPYFPELQPKVESAFQMMVNIGLGMYVFVHLVPAVLSLLPASIRGSLTLKMLIPESPFVGFAAVAAPLFFVLFGSIFFLMLHQLVGNAWLIAAMLFFLGSPLMYVLRARTLTRP